MLPACSSGNVVFPDENLLRTELAKTPVKDYVVSIDTIADVALSQAQKFAKEAVFYVIACILIFVSMILQVFLPHSYGKETENEYLRYIHSENHTKK